jgi:hypothetical protein
MQEEGLSEEEGKGIHKHVIDGALVDFCETCGRRIPEFHTIFEVVSAQLSSFPYIQTTLEGFEAFIKDALETAGSATEYVFKPYGKFTIMDHGGAPILLLNFDPNLVDKKKGILVNG